MKQTFLFVASLAVMFEALDAVAEDLIVNSGDTVVIGSAAESYETINMYGGTLVLPVNYEFGYTTTVNVNGTNYFVADNPQSLAKINIGQGSSLSLSDTGTLINKGQVELGGTFIGNMKGEGAVDSGVVNFNTSSAKIDGDADNGVSLLFYADNYLSRAVVGTIGNIRDLGIGGAVLVYDKDVGSLGNIFILENGTLDIGTRTVNTGSFVVNDGATLALRVASKTDFGKVNAKYAGFTGNNTLKITLDNGVFAKGESANFTFVKADEYSGYFTNKISDNKLYKFVWNTDGSVTITGVASPADAIKEAGGNDNNVTTANAWTGATFPDTASQNVKSIASMLNILSQDTDSDRQKAYVYALTALAPEAAPSVQQTATTLTGQVFGAISTRLGGNYVAPAVTKGVASGDVTSCGIAAWVQNLANKVKLDDTQTYKGFNAKTYGLAMGIEGRLSESLKLGFGYAYADTDIVGFMRSTKAKTHTGFVYGEYRRNYWYINGILSYARSSYDEDKNVVGFGVKADWNVNTVAAEFMTGRNYVVSGVGITPEAGVRYINLKQSSYKDSAEQEVSSHTGNIFTGIVGAKVAKSFALMENVKLVPEVRGALTYDFVTDKSKSVVTLANGQSYTINGKSLERFAAEVGAGATIMLRESIGVYVGYDGKYRKDCKDHSALISVKLRF